MEHQVFAVLSGGYGIRAAASIFTVMDVGEPDRTNEELADSNARPLLFLFRLISDRAVSFSGAYT
jgi:hypothetical protein